MASIDSFISKFYGSTHEYVHQLDPFSTFDITLKFFPCKDPEKSIAPKFLTKIADKIVDATANAAQNALNNMTGGLASSIAGQISNESIKKKHNEYQNKDKYSFVDYLAVAIMLDPGEQKTYQKFVGGMQGSPTGMPQLNLSEFVQSITVPFIGLQANEESVTNIGKFPVNGSFIAPDNNELMLDVLNTKLPIAEYLFYPWMREVTLPYWAYETQPYTTATITVDFSKHADIQYVFCGCRPKTIQTLQPNNVVDGNALKRQVTLLFDFMFITSKKSSVQPKAKDLLLNTGNELLGGAGSMLGL